MLRHTFRTVSLLKSKFTAAGLQPSIGGSVAGWGFSYNDVDILINPPTAGEEKLAYEDALANLGYSLFGYGSDWDMENMESWEQPEKKIQLDIFFRASKK